MEKIIYPKDKYKKVNTTAHIAIYVKSFGSWRSSWTATNY